METYFILFYLFSSLSCLVVGSKLRSSGRSLVDITIANLTSNVQDWEYDIAIMYYAPWCKYCKQLAPYMEQIAIQLKDKPDLVVGKFNCEEPKSHQKLCQELQITHYPTIQFLGYGDFNQGPKGSLLGKTKYPSLVTFSSDLVPDAIFDWIKMLTSISWMHRKWSDFWGIFFPSKHNRLIKKVKNLKNEVNELEKKIIDNRKVIQKYKSDELFDSLADKGDPFPLLQETPTNDNLAFRMCVGDMAEEYCKYHEKEEDFCYTLQYYECVEKYMVPEECRPSSNPFRHIRGQKVVSVCLDEEVIKKYEDAITESNTPTSDNTKTSQMNTQSNSDL